MKIVINPNNYSIGYLPDRYDEPDESDMPRCPICGEEVDTLVRNEDYEIVGCEHCLHDVDAWDWLEEHREGDDGDA